MFDWCRSQNAKSFLSLSVSFSSLFTVTVLCSSLSAISLLSFCTLPYPTNLLSLPTESWHFFSAPIPSLLHSSHPFLLKFSFHFVIALALIFLLYSLPSFPSILLPSFNSVPFFRSQLQFFLFSQGIKCLFNSPKEAGRQAGTAAAVKPPPSSAVLWRRRRIQFQHFFYILAKLIFPVFRIRFRIMQ